MLPLALLLAAAPTTDLSVGIEAGPTFALPSNVLAHAGVFGRFRLEQLVIRTDVGVDASPLPISSAFGDMVAQWAFDPTDALHVAVGGGPTLGFVTAVYLDAPVPIHHDLSAGLIALATIDVDLGSHVALVGDVRALLAANTFTLDAGSVTIAGGVAYRF